MRIGWLPVAAHGSNDGDNSFVGWDEIPASIGMATCCIGARRLAVSASEPQRCHAESEVGVRRCLTTNLRAFIGMTASMLFQRRVPLTSFAVVKRLGERRNPVQNDVCSTRHKILCASHNVFNWIPAFAGMTVLRLRRLGWNRSQRCRTQ